jgi:hypothetical protein
VDTAQTEDQSRRRRWSAWGPLLIERLPWSYSRTVGFLWLLGVAEQALEHWYATAGFTAFSPTLLRRGMLLLMALFTVWMLKVLRNHVLTDMAKLRPLVLISEDEYDRQVASMLGTRKAPERLLMLASILIVGLWFVVLRQPLPVQTDPPLTLPTAVLPAAFVLVMYSLLGWALLVLFYTTLRLGLGLGKLATKPLAVDAYDPARLYPFGHLATWHSFSVVGVVFMMLLALGRPTAVLDYAVVVFLSAASVLALVQPMRGVYRQIQQARDARLAEIAAELRDIHQAVVASTVLPAAELSALASRSGMLVDLRKVLQEAPRWPVRSEGTITRALLVAATPLIYFILQEVMRYYILPLLAAGP